MEQSRYQSFHYLYIFGLIALILGLFALGFSLYLFPLVFLDIQINLPLIIYRFINWFQDEYYLLQDKVFMLIWGFFICTGLILLLIADLVSNYIDNQLLKLKKEEQPNTPEQEKDLIETKHVLMILCIAVLLVLGGIKIFEITISS